MTVNDRRKPSLIVPEDSATLDVPRGIAAMRNQETHGCWCGIPSGLTAEVMAGAGYDWLCVDMQHGLIGATELAAMLQAVAAARKPVLVRVRWNRPDEIMCALDAGADGVVVPCVNTAADALRAAQACRYPPDGIRSWGGPVRAASTRPDYTPQTANSSVLCVVMIESAEGLRDAEEIAATSGVDAVLVGPADLALSLGLGLATDRRREEENELDRALISIAGACDAGGAVAGIAVYGDLQDNVPRWRSFGYRLFAVGGDIQLLTHATEVQIDLLRAL